MSLSINFHLDVSDKAKNKLAPKNSTGGADSTFNYAVIAPSIDSKLSDSSSYYAELSRVVKLAIGEAGDQLTAWRDVVGNEEKEKEHLAVSLALTRKAADDESDEDEAT